MSASIVRGAECLFTECALKRHRSTQCDSLTRKTISTLPSSAEKIQDTMKITKEDVLRVAELAHLELSDAEVESLRAQLDSILSYIDKLKKLDVSGIEPMAQVLQASANPDAALRDDAVRPSSVVAQILEQAPESKKPYFRVPRVIER